MPVDRAPRPLRPHARQSGTRLLLEARSGHGCRRLDERCSPASRQDRPQTQVPRSGRPSRARQAVATTGSGTNTSRAASVIPAHRPQTSVRNNRNARGTPSGNAIASVPSTTTSEVAARRSGPRNTLRLRARRLAGPISPPVACPRVLPIPPGSSPAPASRAAAPRSRRPRRARIDFTAQSGGAHQTGRRLVRLAHPLLDAVRIGSYSSSIDTVASSNPRSLIACRYGRKSTTPRPGGRSPCTRPSQSEI